MLHQSRCDASSTPPGFFRILFPGAPGFPNKIVSYTHTTLTSLSLSHTHSFLTSKSYLQPIPRAFVKHMVQEEWKTGATLVEPNGKQWHVKVFKEEQKMYFGGVGWQELAQALNFEVNYFLTFSYRGNMVFDIKAYDLSACEITYPSIPDHIKSQKSCNNSAYDISSWETTYPSIPDHNKPKKSSNNFNLLADTKVTITKQSSKRRKTMCWSNGRVRFETTITARNLLIDDKYIPTDLVESSTLSEDRKITLRDPEGRLWSVLIGLRKPDANNNPRYHLSKGWLKFAQGNELKIGDKCIFELVSEGKKKVVHAKILRN